MDAIVAVRVPRAVATLLAAALLAFAAPGRAEAPLKALQLKVAGHALRAEVAATVEQRMKGLMFREKLGTNDGSVSNLARYYWGRARSRLQVGA